ncbi:hypothetical protein [uncultured Psychrobacter sp.]|uniref:hypothetical protein n=2 Tax=uncultured Psychrobacter sp. TaxID=259303 RepID=UPI0034589482
MWLLKPKSENEYLSQTIEPFLFWLLSFSFLLSTIIMSGCVMDSPEHNPSIEGDIEIIEDGKGNLCFKPLLSSDVIIGKPVNLKHIRMKDLAILDPNRQGGGYVMLRIKPKNKKYFTLQNGQKICLNSDNPDLEQTVYATLTTQPLAVSIVCLDDKKKYIVNFYREFDYSYTPE